MSAPAQVPSLSRSLSGRKHAIGDDESTSSPTAVQPQEMERGTATSVRVQQLTLELMEQLRIVHNEGFGSKKCCLCCPVADNEGRINSYYQSHPERLPMCGVALGEDGTALGYVQLAIYPMNDKDGLHSTKPGETYVEQIGVAAAARGKGVGKVLLEWAEARAREHQSNVLTLSVLNGNRARRLYERFGFVAKPSDGCEDCIGGCIICVIVGRPYGLCDPHAGVVDMQKRLQ